MPLNGLEFIKADRRHIQSIFNLMALRNPDIDKSKLFERTEREIVELNDGRTYGLFVAVIENSVVGFCRFVSSLETPPERIKYPYPDGIYCMGIIVAPKYRRKGVAKFLCEKRFEILKGLGCTEAYSIVSLDNSASMNMHASFGFRELERGTGFFVVSFDCGEGILYKKILDI